MPRPVKWARDCTRSANAIRARTVTWSQQDIERLFGVGRDRPEPDDGHRAVQSVGAAHLVERASLLHSWIK